MKVKIKATAAKEASVSIGLDPMSAEVLRKFLERGMKVQGLTYEIADEISFDEGDVDMLINDIIIGLDGELV